MVHIVAQAVPVSGHLRTYDIQLLLDIGQKRLNLRNRLFEWSLLLRHAALK